MSNIIVGKSGGGSLNTEADAKRILRIIENNPDRLIWVPSAPGKRYAGDIKVTDMLKKLCVKEHTKDEQKYDLELFEQIIGKFNVIYPDSRKGIKHITSDLEQRCEREYGSPLEKLHSVMVWGEYAQAYLLAELGGFEFVDSTELILTTEPHMNDKRTQEARVLEESYPLIRERLNGINQVHIVSGFQGRTKKSVVTALARGGSDTTQIIIAAAIGSKRAEHFTHEDGICSTLPEIVPDAIKIGEITKHELGELAPSGFDVFQVDALIAAQLYGKGVEVLVRNIDWTPEQDQNPNVGTLIVDSRMPEPDKPVIGIGYTKPFCIFELCSPGLNREEEIMGRVIGIFYDHGYSIEHAPSGINSISIAIEQDQLKGRGALNELCRDLRIVLGRSSQIKRYYHTGRIVAAGTGLKTDRHAFCRFLNALAEENVDYSYVSHPPGRESIICHVDHREAHRAIRALYNEFIRPK